MSREGDIIMHKAYFPPVYLASGSTFGSTGATAVQTVPTGAWGSFGAAGPLNGGEYIGTLTAAASEYDWTLRRTVEIDVSGLTAQDLVEIAIGTTAQRTAPPSMASDGRKGYIREFIIWSTQPLIETDINNLIATFSPTMPNMHGSDGQSGSMTTAMIFGGRADTFVCDSSLDAQIGFLRLIQNSNFGMGDPFVNTRLFCTRLLYGNAAPPTNSNWSGFYVNIPASWELCNAVLAEPEELEFLTTLRRSLIPPEGAN